MLGLWLIYWVIELSEGPIAVEAREGSGNRIRVRLPYGRGGNGNCGRFLSR
jgi:signal transduction histidine kinase